MTKTVDLRDPDAADKAEALYREMIDEAAKSRQKKAISNRGPRHATYLLQTFFRNAENHVRIYTTCLARKVDSEDVYASLELVAAARALLGLPGTRISIVVQDDLDLDDGMEMVEHPFIAALSDVGNRLGVWKHEGERQFGDFAVMDASAYRAELDGEEATAIANFGNPEFASLLARVFDSMVESGRCQELFRQNTPA